jgi:hypothetical protein
LLGHCLAVTTVDGAPVAGRADIGAGERSWVFTPDAPWPEARHLVVVDAMLEDTAGNSVRRVFDRDLDDDAQSPVAVDRAAVEFLPA